MTCAESSLHELNSYGVHQYNGEKKYNGKSMVELRSCCAHYYGIATLLLQFCYKYTQLICKIPLTV